MAHMVDANHTFKTLGGSTLLALPATGYTIEAAGEGGWQWRRDVATSPYVPGGKLKSAVRDTGTYDLIVKVSGSSQAQCQTRAYALRDAAASQSRPEFLLLREFDGASQTFTCWPADFQILTEAPFLWSKIWTVRLTIPIQPA